VSTWITRLDEPGTGLRVAVKDAIDVAGVPTTVGCAAVADTASPATEDAACVATARSAGARVVGKANLHELCFGTEGTNPWFGNPVNPLAADRYPGGSSSGSAVAVGSDEADVGYGTDTGGSVRLPAACCGLVGLKTTWGRIPTTGVWPLSPSLDTVGPIARDVDGVVAGMQLLEPGFAVAGTAAATVVGRVRDFPGVTIDPQTEADVDEALRAAGFEVVDVRLPGLEGAGNPFTVLILTEAWASDRHLYETRPERIGDQIRERLRVSSTFSPDLVPGAREAQKAWQDEVRAVFERVQVLALPTLVGEPPRLDDGGGVVNSLVLPWNVAGTPAVSVPVGRRRPVPTSLQLVGPWHGEELLCATAATVEAAGA
jgi:amidase